MAGYILKIMLEGTHPPVWRRIVAPEKITFEDLHDMIQIIFDWDGDHMHGFEVPQKRIHIVSDDDWLGGNTYVETTTPVDDFFQKCKWIRYTYDFGDEWRHKIIIEKKDETYDKRYASLLKYKGDNFIEDSFDEWELEEDDEVFQTRARAPFDPDETEFRLKGLECSPFEGEFEMLPDPMEELSKMGKMLEKFFKEMTPEKLKALEDNFCGEISETETKIEKWQEFSHELENGITQKPWTVAAADAPNHKTISQLLRKLSGTQVKDYCKYLQIPMNGSEGIEEMANKIAELWFEHPEYLLYVLDEKQYRELEKISKLSPDEVQTKPENYKLIPRLLYLGLADVEFSGKGTKERAEVTLASDLQKLLKSLKSLNAKQVKNTYHNLKKFTKNLVFLMKAYIAIDFDSLYSAYCRITGEKINHIEFNRFVYWHGTMNYIVQTVVKVDDGKSYVMVPDFKQEQIVERMMRYAEHLDYVQYSAEDLRRLNGDINERSFGLQLLFDGLCAGLGLRPSFAGEIIEAIFMSVLEGQSLQSIIFELEDILEEEKSKLNLFYKSAIWNGLSMILLDIEQAMLKGRSRSEYAKLKGISAWSVEMAPSTGKTGTQKNCRMNEFPANIQEKMYKAVNFAAHDEIWWLLRYKETKKIKSEEYIYNLAKACCTGCLFKEASALADELEKSSDQGNLAAKSLRKNIEGGCDVMDEDFDDLDDSGEPEWYLEEQMAIPLTPYVRDTKKVGRNDPCPCGSGKKYKNCCGK